MGDGDGDGVRLGGRDGLSLAYGWSPGDSTRGSDALLAVGCTSAFPRPTRPIMSLMSATVFPLTVTACPEAACTPVRPQRALPDVRNARAREGTGGTFGAEEPGWGAAM